LTFSGSYASERGQRILYITERAVFELDPDGIRLIEIAPGIDLERDILSHMAFRPRIAKNLLTMDSSLFQA
jgi:acyl CoA:acetate/3-ketoacid CoA transferase